MKKFQNILVAFDLNKTLFYKSESPLPRYHDKKINKLFFYVRPHLKELIQYLHTNKINYCFWSNMLGRNCVKYIKELENFGMNKYCGIFDQQFCDKAPENAPEGRNIKSIKNLNKLSDIFEIDPDCCVLVDDSLEKGVQGCHLIHVSSYEGQQKDNQLLSVIERLKQFRKTRVNESDKNLPLLQYTKYEFQEEKKIFKPKQKPQTIYVQKVQKMDDKETKIQSDPQMKKFKSDLVLEKQNRKKIIEEIQKLQKENTLMAQEIKKQSEGKTVRKGDDLLVQVLMFAKSKKANQKKIEQLKQKKKSSEQKIQMIKKIMSQIREKILNLGGNQKNQKKQSETKPQNHNSEAAQSKISKKEQLKESYSQSKQKIQ